MDEEDQIISRKEYIRGFQDASAQKPKRYIKSGNDKMYDLGYEKGQED